MRKKNARKNNVENRNCKCFFARFLQFGGSTAIVQRFWFHERFFQRDN